MVNLLIILFFLPNPQLYEYLFYPIKTHSFDILLLTHFTAKFKMNGWMNAEYLIKDTNLFITSNILLHYIILVAV